MMIYAALIRKTDSALSVGAMNGRPLFPILAFASKSAFDAKQDELWKGDRFEGNNLIRLSAKQVYKWFPTERVICKCGVVKVSTDYHPDCNE